MAFSLSGGVSESLTFIKDYLNLFDVSSSVTSGKGEKSETGRSMKHREIQRTAGRNQRSEIRRQRSGVKLISDLRLLTSMIDDYWLLNSLIVDWGL
jgi:hypothetical protein